ncbi:MAG TPA: hypothetical protein VHB98_22140, partial [Chloroflexota bacterium]|nr:hypothetical protein [Chloroflexota bacterium]
MLASVRGRLRGRTVARLVIVLLCSFLLLPGLAPAVTHAQAPAAAPRALSLPNGTLIRDLGTGRIYFVWEQARHLIESEAALVALGYSLASVRNFPAADTALLPESNPIGVRVVSGGLLWPLAPVTSAPTTLTVSTPGVAPGGDFRLDGSGFAAGETVALAAPGLQFAVRADSSGNFSTLVPVVAGAQLGKHPVCAFGVSSRRFGIQVFTAIAPAPTPALRVQPNPVAHGAAVLVSGSGFAAGEQVELFLTYGTSTARVTANADGAFAQAPLPVPASQTTGTNAVHAYGSTSARWATTTVTVAAAAPPPSPPPATAPVVAVTPRVISPGTQVLVSGSGFVPNELVLIRLNGTLEGNVSADVFGSFGGFLFTVPVGAAPGVYTVSATGATSSRTASIGLSVQAAQPAALASISVSPNATLPGAVIVVAGTGFQPGEAVAISFNGAQMERLVADGTGSFTGGSFTLPGTLAPGTYTVTANGLTSGRSATASLSVSSPSPTVVVRLSVAPDTVTPGSKVTFSGSGYAAGETVLIRFNGGLVGSIAAGPAGTFVGTFQAPSVTGTYSITATGASSGNTASATLHVARPTVPGIGLVPDRVHRGSTVLVNGNNFLPGEIVLVRFRGQLVQAAQADSQGRIYHASFVVPGTAPYGVSTVSITGSRSGRSASALLAVRPAPARGPRLSVSPTTVHRGTTVSVSGHGYQGGELVLIRFRGSLVQSAMADRNGSFSHARFRVPVNSPYGKASLSVLGARSGRSASATLHVTRAPGIGISVSPGTVRRGGRLTVSGHGFAGGEI